jgi:hypothetical protein
MELSIIISIGLILLGLILFAVLRNQKHQNDDVVDHTSSKHKDEEPIDIPEDTQDTEDTEDTQDTEPEYNATQEAVYGSSTFQASRDLADKLREIKASKSNYTVEDEDDEDEDDDEDTSGEDRFSFPLGKVLGIMIVIGVGFLVLSNVMSAVKETNVLQEVQETNTTNMLYGDIAQQFLNFNPLLMMGLMFIIIWFVFKGFTRNDYA